MWTYNSRTGSISRGSKKALANGYSGQPTFKNKPEHERLVAKGPIPRGKWKMTGVYNSKNVGPFAIVLEPVGHDAFGRSAFRIHGDSIRAPGTASHGCIILPRAVREAVWASGDRDLEVV